MMVDALLFNQPDSAYFQKSLAIEQIAFDVLASSDKPGIWLAGPERWNPEKKPSLPLALVWKISAHANGGLQPSSHGHILLSHESGGRTVMAKLLEQDKLPLPSAGEAGAPKRDKPAPERLIAGELWWDADTSQLGGLAGEWTAAVICGGWISNQHRIKVEEPAGKDAGIRAGQAPGSPGAAAGTQGGAAVASGTLTAGELAGFEKTHRHPALPERGVQFKLGLSEDDRKMPLLFGSYALPEKHPGADLVLNAFISGLGFKDARQWKIRLPAAAAKTEAGIRKGWFLLDLEQRLRNPRLENFEFPADIYITFVHGSWFSRPEHLDPGAFR